LALINLLPAGIFGERRIIMRLEKRIARIIDKKGYDLTKRLPYGFACKTAKDIGITSVKVRETVNAIRKSRHISVQQENTVKLNDSNGFNDVCRDNNLMRQGNKEGLACKSIRKFVMDNLPRGGHGLLFGTPIPLCVSDHPTFNKTLIDDELAIAHTMVDTCDGLTIVIGDAVKNAKAQFKVDTWKRLYTMHKANVVKEPVNRDSFTRWMTKLIEKHSICKVVLITSGSWTNSKSSWDKYRFDVNFEAPSKYLTSIYPNLHILALTMSHQYMFSVKYVSGGSETTIYGK